MVQRPEFARQSGSSGLIHGYALGIRTSLGIILDWSSQVFYITSTGGAHIRPLRQGAAFIARGKRLIQRKYRGLTVRDGRGPEAIRPPARRIPRSLGAVAEGLC